MSCSQYCKYLLLATVFLVADRVIKEMFVVDQVLATGWFSWLPFPTALFFNTGAIFSIAAPQWMIIVVASVVLLVIARYAYEQYQQGLHSAALGWSCILIGGVSNVWDRLVYGGVIDWLVMPWRAVVNLADLYIAFGVTMVLLSAIWQDSRIFTHKSKIKKY